MGNRQASGRGEAGAAAPDLGDQVGDLTGEVREQAVLLTDQAREQIASRLTVQKDQAASGLETISLALRQTGEQIRQQDQGTIAQYIDGAADQVERLSDQLRTQDLGQLVEATERLARRHSALFAGSALALGFLATRFLRSSQPRQRPDRDYAAPRGDTPYGRDVYAPDYAGTMPAASLGYGGVTGTGAMPGLDRSMDETGLSNPPATPASDPRGPEEL